MSIKIIYLSIHSITKAFWIIIVYILVMCYLFARYASRVKLITNDASKNADNKEISRLKGIISMMKKGDSAAAADEVDEQD